MNIPRFKIGESVRWVDFDNQIVVGEVIKIYDLALFYPGIIGGLEYSIKVNYNDFSSNYVVSESELHKLSDKVTKRKNNSVRTTFTYSFSSYEHLIFQILDNGKSIVSGLLKEDNFDEWDYYRKIVQGIRKMIMNDIETDPSKYPPQVFVEEMFRFHKD